MHPIPCLLQRHPNLGRKSASGRRRIAFVEEAFSDGEYNSPDPESSAAKRSRKEPEQPDVILYKCSEDASVIGTDSNLSASRKLPGGDTSLNYCSKLPERNSFQVLSHRIVSACFSGCEETTLCFLRTLNTSMQINTKRW